MRKAELILFVVAFMATIGNLNLISGSEFALVASMSSLGVIYIFGGMSGFQNSLRSITSFENHKTAFIFKISGYSMSILAMGILFYQLIWPGDRMMIIVGSLSCLIALIAVLFMQKEVNSEQRKSLFPRLLIWTILGVLFLFLPQKNWVAVKYKNHPSVVESFENMQNDPKNDSLRDVFKESMREIE
jgi:hypothetical protein